MTMHDVFSLALAGLGGVLLGLVFFGGLWWTVFKAVQSPRPALWFILSFVLRMGLVVAGIASIGGSHWMRFAACVCGFLLARCLIIRVARLPCFAPQSSGREVSHAP